MRPFLSFNLTVLLSFTSRTSKFAKRRQKRLQTWQSLHFSISNIDFNLGETVVQDIMYGNKGSDTSWQHISQRLNSARILDTLNA